VKRIVAPPVCDVTSLGNRWLFSEFGPETELMTGRTRCRMMSQIIDLPKETILIGATLFCLGALFALFSSAPGNYSAPAPSAIAYPIDASNS
jgi:hypothetical protein